VKTGLLFKQQDEKISGESVFAAVFMATMDMFMDTQ
jgi:hypothetical protein